MRILHKKLCLLMILLISCPLSLLAQNKTITGTVKDAMDVVIGASVVVKGTSIGTITDLDGHYSISVPTSAKQLTFSFVGYENQTVTISNQTKIDVTLAESSQMLDEVVAIGYAKVRRKDLTGSTSSLAGNDIKAIPVTSAAQALSGRIPGVNVTSKGGAPGASVNIVIRGGMSITQSNDPLYIVDGFQLSDALSKIDATDIESIDVLKDASATAIYGAQGANGVVLITTKSGKTGKLKVEYNGYISANKLGKKLDVLGTMDYLDMQYEKAILDGQLTQYTQVYGNYADRNSIYAGRPGIDWQDEVYGGSAFQQNHNVNMSGGSDATKIALSYNNTKEDGIMSRSGFLKNNLRFKLDQEITKKIRFSLNMNYQSTKKEGAGSQLGSTILMRPTGGILMSDEDFIHAEQDPIRENGINGNFSRQNPLMLNDAITKTSWNRRFQTDAALEFDLLKGLTFKTALSYDFAHSRSDYWEDNRTIDGFSANFKSSRENKESDGWRNINTLSYNTKFGTDHELNLLIGNEWSKSGSVKTKAESSNYPEDNFGLDQMQQGTLVQPNETGSSRGTSASFFGRAFYGYKSKYLATVTLRTDGSSKFATGQRWGWFPSASLAWRITEENFMKNQNIFDNLKLRIGYGTAGNNQIDNNLYVTSFGTTYYAHAGDYLNALQPSTTLGNKFLKWETIKTQNIGLDMAFLKSRLNATVEFYRNESSDLLLNVNIPAMTGFKTQMQNIGKTRNTGLEIQLNSINLRSKDFTWSTDFNISFNKNKVVKLAGSSYMLMDDSRFKIEEGKSVGQIYGYIYDGIYSSDDFDQNSNGSYILKQGIAHDKGIERKNVKVGDAKFKVLGEETDKEGNPVWSAADRTVIGNGNPDFSGGLNNTLKYKNWDFNVFMDFVYGNDLVNLNNQSFTVSQGMHANGLTIMNGRYRLVNTTTGKEETNLEVLREMNPNPTLWSIGKNNTICGTYLSTFNVEDGSYLRISNISLGYTLPKPWLKKIGVEKLRLYGTVYNVHTFTNYSGYDPDVSSNGSVTRGLDSGNYPTSKRYVFGVNLTF